MPISRSDVEGTYVNPVYDRSFPDPFVLKHRGEYYAYCTGIAADGRVFGVLHSSDLVNWTELSGAMEPLEAPYPHYWAPEVTYHNGQFYLYYSVGNETLMEIRVAVCDRPAGVFKDSGCRLTSEEFAIDPHVIKESDGKWSMFYATDFLEHTHIGTGTVVDRLIGPFELEGKPRPVTRARYDWQVYDPARKEKGGVRWHTVEGPCVLERKGIFYQMFSGGNWQNDSYGVSFATSSSLFSDDEWQQHSDGNKTKPILMTIPGSVVGPGHNSVVAGPNGRELFCVYHRWNESGRVMAIDRLDFAGGSRMFVLGPSASPQPMPYQPRRLTEPNNGEWEVLSGKWEGENGVLISEGNGSHEIGLATGRGADLRCTLSFRFHEKEGSFAVRLRSTDIDMFTFQIEAEPTMAWAQWPRSGGSRDIPLPADFDVTAVHDVTFDLEHESVRLAMDSREVQIDANLSAQAAGFSVIATNSRVELGSVDVTFGFEELFQTGELIKRGWTNYGNRGVLLMDEGLLRLTGEDENSAAISRRVPAGNFLLNINLRIAAYGKSEGRLFFGCGNSFVLSISSEAVIESNGRSFTLPDSFDPNSFVQFRIIRKDDRVDLFLENDHVCTLPAENGDLLRIMAQDLSAEIEMVRYTLI